MTDLRWSLVVPVKRLGAAKSRLDLPPSERAALALAMAVDTLVAVLSTPRVERLLIVSGEDSLRAALGQQQGTAERTDDRVTWVDDPGRGLGGAIDAGIDALTATSATASAILLGDLPALRPAELDAALAAACAYPRATVPDADGMGTTLLTALRPQDLRPHFGPGSRRAHEEAGHVVLDGAWPTLRRDVDTAADLGAAIRLGVGRRTAAAVDGLNPGQAGRGVGRSA